MFTIVFIWFYLGCAVLVVLYLTGLVMQWREDWQRKERDSKIAVFLDAYNWLKLRNIDEYEACREELAQLSFEEDEV